MVAQRQYLFILASVGLLAGCVGPGYDDGYSNGGYPNSGYSGGYAPAPYAVIERGPEWGRRVYQEPPPRYEQQRYEQQRYEQQRYEQQRNQPQRYEQPPQREQPQAQRGPDRPHPESFQPQARGRGEVCQNGGPPPCQRGGDGANK